METKLVLLLVALLAGCGTLKSSDTVTEVPIAISAKVTMPEKPSIAASKLSLTSTQDEVLKAALKDLEGYRTYSKQLEKLLEAK